MDFKGNTKIRIKKKPAKNTGDMQKNIRDKRLSSLQASGKCKSFQASKKSQLTLFIILGLIAIILFSISYYFLAYDSKKTIQHTQKDDIDSFIEKCLEDSAKSGIQKIGMSGGYIISEAENNMPGSLSKKKGILKLNSHSYLPYWYYATEAGIQKISIPKLKKSYPGDSSIQDTLERYINRSIGSCINGFKEFKKQGIEIKKKGKQEVSVFFAENDVVISLNMPIEIKKGGKTITKKQFSAKLLLPFKKLYELATDITNKELKTAFLDRNTRDLIFIYSRIDKNYLPPMYGGLIFADCSNMVIWDYSYVKKSLKNMLSQNLPFLHIAETDFERIKLSRIEDKSYMNEKSSKNKRLRQAIYDRMVISINSSKSYKDFSVAFSYLPSTELSLSFGKGMALMPNSYKIDLLTTSICMMEYKFSYSLSYPVIVTITTDFDNSLYLFRFPIEVIIANNYPRASLPEIESEKKENAPSLCSKEQLLGKELKLNLYDEKGRKIDDALILFQCGPRYFEKLSDKKSSNITVENMSFFSDSCAIGKTKNGSLNTRLPQCSGGGLIMAMKKGYSTKLALIGDTIENEKNNTITLKLALDKAYKLRLKVLSYFVKGALDNKNPDCSLDYGAEKLLKAETAIISLRKKDGFESDYSSFISYNELNDSQNFIRLSPGEYSVRIKLIKTESYPGEMVIKKHSTKKTFNSLFSKETIAYPDEDIEIASAITGGSYFNFTVTSSELDDNKTITFFAFDFGEPYKIEHLSEAIDKIGKCSSANREAIIPLIS